MRRLTRFLRLLAITSLALLSQAAAVPKSHVISFGKWMTVQSLPFTGVANIKPLTLKVRPLLLDSHTREFTVGPAHDVTDRLFVVQRAFRVNDSLPQESASTPHWQWQRGGWLLVDRVTGHISQINLQEFDAVYSAVSWYRDYAAYCGISEDGKKIYEVVAQIGRRKAVLKKSIEGQALPENAAPDSACPPPAWQRSPTRVSFEPAASSKQVFALRGYAVNVVNESDGEEDEEASK